VKASIIIRSKNEARFIGEVLQQIFAQIYNQPFEVLLLDSGSRDDTVKIASKFPVTFYPIKPEEFTFGRALNRGAQLAKGDYVVFLSAHCTPVDREWLARLLHPIEEHSDVAATYGRQEPRRGVNPFEEMELDWIFPSDGSREPPVIFSSANCAIQREILLRYPFDEFSPGAEDYIWRKLLPKAHRSIYIPSASVYHSHPLNLRYWAARFGIDGELIPYLSRTYGMEYYGETSQSPLSSFLKWSYSLARREYRYFRDNRYVLHLLLIPPFEAFRISCFWRGLRRGRLTYGRPQ
jgi:glycosyltransferase involved in cell wall biosynthesis